MKKTLLKILKISVPAMLVTFLLLELVVRVFLSACERPSTYFDHENKIVKYQSGEGTYTVGLSASIKGDWRINPQGWNSTVDFSEKTDLNRIVIIGDSYVEGFHVNVSDRFSELLRDKVADSMDVIELGRAGAPLTQYLHMARFAYEKYHPNTLVFNVVANDFDGSLAHLNPAAHFLRLEITDCGLQETEITPYPEDKTNSFWKYSALVRYLYYNAKLGLISSAHQSQEAYEKAKLEHEQLIEENFEEIELAMDYVFSTLKTEFPDVRILVILDAPRPAIYHADYTDCQEARLFEACANSCLDNNIEVINMGSIMHDNYQKDQQVFEYEEDMHWNSIGHQLVFETLLKKL